MKERNFLEFNFAAIDGEPKHDDMMAALGMTLGEVFWFVGADMPREPNPRTVGLRTLALLWVIRPEAVGNLSLSELSKRIGCTDTILSRYACEFRDRFGIQSRSQRSDATRWKMRQAQRTDEPSF